MSCSLNSYCKLSLVESAVTADSSGENLSSFGYISSELCDILGLKTEKKEENLDAEVEALIEQRQAARKAKDFAKADEIRDKLLAMGIQLKDTREGVQWKRI